MRPVILPPAKVAGVWFPDPHRGPGDQPVAVGGDLSVERLVLAYRMGLFPWSVRPITWWSPDPRAILEVEGLHISRSLARVWRRELFRLTCNQAFPEIIRGCATAHDTETWITPEFITAYTALHQAGWAHSIEVWQDNVLVGGLYGVAVGGLFAAESMFHRVSNASKIAVCALVERLRQRGFQLLDIQMLTPITTQLGGVEIRRDDYLARLARAVLLPVTFI
jgi:leucyl/phenylalanyl-tRNA--protein transferase